MKWYNGKNNHIYDRMGESMKKARNELLLFVVGLAMLVAGLFILSQRVMVRTSFLGGFMSFGGYHFSNGLIMVPFIIGIIWMFASGAGFLSKVLTGAGVLFIVIMVIMNTNISLVTITLYEWVMILVLIFGGIGLLARVLLTNPDKGKTGNGGYAGRRDRSIYTDDVEKELERIKKGK